MAVPRTQPSHSTPFEAFELTLSDVYLLTRDKEGEVAVPRMGVVIDQLGLTVMKPDGSVGAVIEWGQLKSLRVAGRMEVRTGEPAVLVEATTTVRPHRFAVPTDDPEGLERVVGELASFTPTEKKRGLLGRFRELGKRRAG